MAHMPGRPSIESPKTKCPVCGGRGRINQTSQDGTKTVPCPRCKGESVGVIRK